ncbi:MAG: carbonic anhydrase family protein [Tenuifilaceae bacterium]|jgi:carbonic anhydrase|nr:carbonic anhydrase family protein [Tenuifilaceae bacterium]
MWTHTKESQDKITPQLALQYLKEGNLRFLGNLKAQRNLLKQVNATSEGQFPFATILSCIDSRTSAELIFDQGLGDIFSIRIAGNILNNDILGSMEYACSIANSKVVVVLGHTKCGAIIGACNSIKLGHIAGITKKIEPAILREATIVDDRTGNNMEFVNRVSIQNVMLTISQVRAQSPVLKDLEQQGKILIVGGIYNIDTGEVTFIDGV